jgi:hypothetical protein
LCFYFLALSLAAQSAQTTRFKAAISGAARPASKTN